MVDIKIQKNDKGQPQEAMFVVHHLSR